MTDHRAVVRLAHEGVPVAAIARAMGKPFEVVFDVLRHARDAGDIAELPRADWKPGESREERKPERAEPSRHWRKLTQKRLNKSEAAFVSLLAERGFVSIQDVIKALNTQAGEGIVRVYACHARKKLAPHGITFETVINQGYRMASDHREATKKLLAEAA